MSNYVKFRVSTFVDVLAPVNGVAVKTSLSAALENECRITSAVLTVSMRDHTAGEGPLIFGVAHPDYSVTEIAETLGATPLGPGKKIEQERANRLIRELGTLDGLSTEEKANDGRPIRAKLNWLVQEGQVNLSFWVFNVAGQTLTTGSDVVVSGHFNGFWQ